MAKRGIDEQALFDAALEEFSIYSYKEASINRIISAAGIAKGSFYYRFKTKYELYLFLIKEGVRRKWEYINSEIKFEPKGSPDGDIFDFILLQAEIGVRFAKDFPGLYQLGKMFSKEKGTSLYEQVMEELGGGDESGLQGLIEEAFHSGILRQEFSLDFIQKLILSLFSSFDDIFFKNEEMELERALAYLKDFIRFIKHGLQS
ncbi:MAG: TetR/AcrR family transcriptional regulator [Spirochaetales bacterium]|nr:TetR/AcrR family transcriptional regulator [Spirochaetales bacterium]